MCDDLNTPKAIAELHELRRGQSTPHCVLASLRAPRLLGKPAGMQARPIGRQGEDRRADRRTRLDARKAKNWAEADRIRDELAAMGVVLKDNKDGTTWEVKR